MASEDDTEGLAAWKTAGADLNWSDYDFRTPLHIATADGRQSVIEVISNNIIISGIKSNIIHQSNIICEVVSNNIIISDNNI